MRRDLKKRKHLRIENPFVLRLQIKQDKDKDATPSDWNMVSANNLSAGGVFLYYSKDLKVGSLVELKISIPEQTTTIHCIGETVRTKKHPKSPIYEIAISFKEISEQERKLINNIIENYLQANFKKEDS